MEVDIHIYLKTLRDFFKNNPNAQEGLLSQFPGVEFDVFMIEVERIALHNYNTSGDPTISKKQILDVLQILRIKTIKYGLQDLINEGGLDIEKDENGAPQIRFNESFKKELEELKVFQISELGPICLN